LTIHIYRLSILSVTVKVELSFLLKLNLQYWIRVVNCIYIWQWKLN